MPVKTKISPTDIRAKGEFWCQASVPKIAIGMLAILTLTDSFLVSKQASPGHAATLTLGWVLITRLWMASASRVLVGFCAVISIVCILENHGLLSGFMILQNPYFYFASSLLILFWERISGIRESRD